MTKDKLGATGRFPDGKLDPTDEGELRMAVSTTKAGLVRIDFGKRVAWFALGPQETADLAAMLVKHAREAARVTGRPVTFSL